MEDVTYVLFSTTHGGYSCGEDCSKAGVKDVICHADPGQCVLLSSPLYYWLGILWFGFVMVISAVTA